MSYKKEDELNSKWIGIGIIVLAIVLIILTVQTNFFEDLSVLNNDKYIRSGEQSITLLPENEETDNQEKESQEEIYNKSSGEQLTGSVNSVLDVYYLYVGQGDATFIKNGDKTMLIDAGNNPDGKYISKWLRNTMHINKVDYLIGTHSHEDHIGGMDIILEDFDIGTFYMPSKYENNKTYQDVVNWAKKKNVKITTPSVGTKFNVGEAECEIMSIDNTTEDINATSIVIQLNFGMQKFLFTGDMITANEEARSWEDIDVLKVAHHGSTYSSSQDFLKQVKPEIAVISCGKNNDYYYPHEAVLKRLNDVACKEIYDMSEEGTILIKCDGKTNKIEKLELNFDGNK